MEKTKSSASVHVRSRPRRVRQTNKKYNAFN